MVWAPRCFRTWGARWSRRIISSAKDLSSRNRTLKRGFSFLMKLDSSSRASVSDAVTTSSIERVRDTIRPMRWVWKRPCAYWMTRFFSDLALPT
ncbi:hypothetical protein D3C85_1546550 [compost metagenome]